MLDCLFDAVLLHSNKFNLFLLFGSVSEAMEPLKPLKATWMRLSSFLNSTSSLPLALPLSPSVSLSPFLTHVVELLLDAPPAFIGFVEAFAQGLCGLILIASDIVFFFSLLSLRLVASMKSVLLFFFLDGTQPLCSQCYVCLLNGFWKLFRTVYVLVNGIQYTLQTAAFSGKIFSKLFLLLLFFPLLCPHVLSACRMLIHFFLFFYTPPAFIVFVKALSQSIRIRNNTDSINCSFFI